jgi:N-hydroxyarylamine O-acetyltransferase
MTVAIDDGLDLNAYLARIGYDGPRTPTAPVLQALHLAHATRIPFENLDVLLGRPIRLDLASLQAKLVHGRRGGYCFEQNTLFAAVLERFGFSVARLAARVRFGATRLLPRTHMLLAVQAEATVWLADVGFGGAGLLWPLPLETGTEVRQFLWTYRLIEEPGQRLLQLRRGDGWMDLYAFTQEALHPVDFEMANHFTATYPESIFVRSLTVQRPTPQARFVLRNGEYTVEHANGTDVRRLKDAPDWHTVLTEAFGLNIAPEDLTAALAQISLSP